MAARMGLFGASKYFNLRAQIDAMQPGAWFAVAPYVGYLERRCTARFERDIRAGREPTLAQVTGALKNGCRLLDVVSSTCRPRPNDQQLKSWEACNTNFAGLTIDALLYLHVPA